MREEPQLDPSLGLCLGTYGGPEVGGTLSLQSFEGGAMLAPTVLLSRKIRTESNGSLF
jgi:hypothetical protein